MGTLITYLWPIVLLVLEKCYDHYSEKRKMKKDAHSKAGESKEKES